MKGKMLSFPLPKEIWLSRLWDSTCIADSSQVCEQNIPLKLLIKFSTSFEYIYYWVLDSISVTVPGHFKGIEELMYSSTSG